MKKPDAVIWIAVSLFMIFSGVQSAFGQLSCPANMVSYWRFEEGAGATANDSVSGNHGSLAGGPTWGIGKVGGGLSFDGVDDHVNAGRNPNLNFTNQMTMEAWINISSIPGPFQWYGVTDKGKFEIYIYNGGSNILTQGLWFVISGIEYDLFDRGTIQIIPGAWTHVAATFDGTNIRAYVNGQLDFTVSAPGTIDDSSATDFFIGREPSAPGNHFNGGIDEVAVYNRALTQQEIQTHYQNGLGGLGYCDSSQTLFADVPLNHWAYNMIMAISEAGLTGGCSTNPSLFCPDSSLTRGQMAVFIETSLGVNPDFLPPCSGSVFNDVNSAAVGEVLCRFIEDFATRAITGGCFPDNLDTPGVNEARYCPGDPVTRAQMAVFIERALGVVGTPSCSGGVFGDVTSGSVGAAFCGFVEDFAAAGITGGCSQSPPLYCPNGSVTRAEMAVFVVAAPPPLNP